MRDLTLRMHRARGAALNPPAQLFSARIVAACLVTAVALFGVLAQQAGAATSFSNLGAFATGGPDGALHHRHKIAVDHHNGMVLVVNDVENRIDVWAPSGGTATAVATLGGGDFPVVDPYGIAIDQANGDVYISDAGRDEIARYTNTRTQFPDFQFDPTFATPTLGTGAGQIGDFRAPLAIDPVTGKLLVADPGNDLVKRFTDTGAYDNFSFDGTGSSGVFTGLQDIAVDSTGDVIVIDSDGGDAADGAVTRVERFSSAGVWEATIGPVTGGGAANVAVRPATDELVISGNQDAVNNDTTPTLFVYDSSTNTELTFPGDVIYSTVSGLALDDGPGGKLYVATDTSRGFYPTAYGKVSIQVYEPPIPPTPPTIDETSASDVTPFRAKLNAKINPGNAGGTYSFEYGTTTAYGSETPTTPFDAGTAVIDASASLIDLEPGTTYHFRAVATNSEGAAEGPDETFTTPDQPATVVMDPAIGIGTTTATVRGTVSTHGLAGTYRFTIADADGPYRWTSPEGALSASEDFHQITASPSDLAAGREYVAHFEVTTGAGTVYSGRETFSTVPLPPAPFANPAVFVLPGYPVVAPERPSSPAPSNRFALTVGKGGLLRVKVPGKGTVSVRGSGLRRVVRRPRGKGTATIRLTLTKAGRTKLAKSKSGTLSRKVTVSFRPTGGSTRSVTRTVTFRR